MSMNEQVRVDAQTEKKKVLVVQSDCIIGGVLLSLIAGQENLDVVTITIDHPIDLTEEVTRIEPDVILLDDQGQLDCNQDLHNLLEVVPTLKIVILNSNDNHIKVISKNQFDIKSADHFFEMI
jgi:chemotaxis response regulator CheB